MRDLLLLSENVHEDVEIESAYYEKNGECLVGKASLYVLCLRYSLRRRMNDLTDDAERLRYLHGRWIGTSSVPV